MKKLIRIVIVSFLCIVAINCSKDDDAANTPQQNEAPNTFNLIAVTNEATDIDVLPNFSWQAAIDPESDVVTYDLYLDTNPNPTTLYEQNISTTNFKVEERLHLVTNYYWKVIAKDSNGNTTESNVHKFTTRNLNFPLNPIIAAAAFPERSEHTSVVFDDKLWVIAGFEADVVYSENGVNWKAATTSAPFSSRHGHTSATFDNKIWLIAGKSAFFQRNDVWASIDGSTWTEVTSSAQFSERADHTSVVFNNKLWVIGGYEEIGGNLKNDVWFSADGVTWTEATAAAAFSARADHTTVVFDNKLWVIGGSDPSLKNDVWSSTDGVTWIEVTAAAAFSERVFHTTVVFDDKLWLFGGIDGDFKSDVWSSADGINWKKIIDPAPFSERISHTTVVFDDKIWLIAGEDSTDPKNDVWVMD